MAVNIGYVLMGAKPLNITLPEKLKDQAQQFAVEKNYGSISRLIQHLLRQELDKNEQRNNFEKLLEQGINSGVSDQSPENFFAQVRARLKTKSGDPSTE